MYNRYTPQADGSYHREQMPDPARKPNPPPQIAPLPPSPKEGAGISSFLRQLLPQNFDTGDLFIILLLLLMAGDSEEEKGNALLTLAFYLFL